MTSITPKQELILQQLAHYKYLTVSQLIVLGVSKDRSFINKQLKRLRDDFYKPLVYSQHFGVDPTKGKLESVHGLTRHGAKLLEEQGRWNDKIKSCSTQQQLFASQYWHRKYTIDIQIAIEQFCGKQDMSLEFYHNYFEKESTGMKNGYRSVCSFEYNTQGCRMESDALFLMGHRG